MSLHVILIFVVIIKVSSHHRHYVLKKYGKRSIVFVATLNKRFEQLILLVLVKSSLRHNLDGVLINIMGEHKSKLLFIWDQGQCTDTGFMCLENKEKPFFLKELQYVWQKKLRDVESSSSNTILITDLEKALFNPPNTSIFPGNFDPNNKLDDFLGPHGELRAEANDVPTYVKDHPIG
nr:uncharacterized FCP1 homology domain-containing protein C1271.03c-like [Tanacetum cinerariifolium]GEZ28144.1 uncharacterized FCP1 homology domain-containing protein C1271.03c-like [Tanacetum cinerariifolium]